MNQNISWFIFTYKGCGYCKKAKDLLKNKHIDFIEIEVNDSNKLDIYNSIDKITGKYRYFPVIFNNGNFIGGYTELQKM